MKKLQLVLFVLTSYFGFSQNANEALVAFHKNTFPEAKLTILSPKVTVAFAYSYANFSFIESENGTIVIDTGWFPGEAKKAFEEYQKINDKPIIAIIYTHLHPDHYGGSTYLASLTEKNIQIIAPKGWQNWLNYQNSPIQPMVIKRGYSQMGVLLPLGDKGTVGAAVGISPRINGRAEIKFPNTVIDKETTIKIDGITLQLIPSSGDLKENLMIWFPEDKVLFGGDIIGGTFPYIETARFELERDPEDFIHSITKSLALEPAFVVGGHGRILKGREDVLDVLSSNIDLIQFMINQLDRAVVKGWTADQVIDNLKLPKALENHKDLQAHYHKISWIIRQMHVKRVGFFQNINDLSKKTASYENKKLMQLIGGEQKVLEAIQKAYVDEEYAWAASLADKLLSVNPTNEEAITYQNKAFLQIARKTISANERNYLLSHLKKEIPWQKIYANTIKQFLTRSSVSKIIKKLESQVIPENTENLNLNVQFKVDGKIQNTIVRNNILVLTKKESNPDLVITLSKADLIAIVIHKTTWNRLLTAKNITILKGENHFVPFTQIFETAY
jgi:alkyl sulfatase BDS1-like metallo-beta-lactamase superfamily hydrolase